MARTQSGHRVILGKVGPRTLPVQGAIFTEHQSTLGPVATLLWLNLRWAAHAETAFDVESFLAMFPDEPDIVQASRKLQSCGLLEIGPDGQYLVHDPVPQERAAADAEQDEQPVGQLKAIANSEMTAAQEAERDEAPVLRSPLSRRRKRARTLKLVEPQEGAGLPQNPDMQAVVQIYHKRIGMIGPTQYEKLRFWVEEQGMDGAVVALAIEETVHSAEVPRISYLEGILRNWHNDGIRTLADVHERKRASKVLAGGRDDPKRDEGLPNASAYQSVSEELVERWKELYPDEYDG